MGWPLMEYSFMKISKLGQ